MDKLRGINSQLDSNIEALSLALNIAIYSNAGKHVDAVMFNVDAVMVSSAVHTSRFVISETKSMLKSHESNP